MEKEIRRLKQVPLATKVAKLKEWRENSGWSSKVAGEKLGVAKGTLLGWNKALNNIPEFAILKSGTQESWISRFIHNYQDKPVGQPSQEANVSSGEAGNKDPAQPATEPTNTGSGTTNNIREDGRNNDVESGSDVEGGLQAMLFTTEAQRKRNPTQKRIQRQMALHVQEGSLNEKSRRANLDSDSLIYKHMIKVDTSVWPLGSTFYTEIANAYHREKIGENVPDEVTGSFDWGAQKYVLLPITGADHYSFAIIENPLTPAQTVCYHINSLRGCHKSESILDTLKWFLSPRGEKRKKRGADNSNTEPPVFAYKKSPLHANLSDCGVDMQHYVHKVARFISEEKPASMAEKM
ncbi:hypothetical protein ON010_g8939 [Phytophthora cinnamomi]|nr:hypothetical protein ON010_g8939 [Phytophthora cinnamomi]